MSIGLLFYQTWNIRTRGHEPCGTDALIASALDRADRLSYNIEADRGQSGEAPDRRASPLRAVCLPGRGGRGAVRRMGKPPTPS